MKPREAVKRIFKSPVGRLILLIALLLLAAPLVVKLTIGRRNKPRPRPAITTPAVEEGASQLAEVEPAEARAMQQNGQAVLLDVREAGLAEHARLPGAVNIPLAELNKRRDELPQDKLIITYAYTRIPAEVEAAKMAAALLSQDGTRRAAVLKGNSENWLAAGFPVELPQLEKRVKGNDPK